MKKIIFTVTNDLNFDQRMVRICSALSESGFSCVLVGRRKASSRAISDARYLQKRLYCFFEKGKLFYLEYNIRLLLFLLFSRFDVICSIDLDTSVPGLIATGIKRKKHFFDAHELFSEVPEVKDRKAVKRVWEFVQRITFKRTDVAYTVGNELARYFEGRYGRKVEVVRNIPGIQDKLPYRPDKDKFILYQGALNEGRGLEILLEAMKDIPCRLVLAGEGDLSGQLRGLASSYGLGNKVHFAGMVAPGELRKLTSTAWIGFNVSENAGLSYYLSLNNKFFDYIHAGLPSLVNPFPEYIALNKHYFVGVITDPVVSDIVKNVKALLNDQTLHSELSQNCEKAALELNWEEEKKKLLHLYKSELGLR